MYYVYEENKKNKVYQIWWIYYDGKLTLTRFGFNEPSSGYSGRKNVASLFKQNFSPSECPDEGLLKPKRFNVATKFNRNITSIPPFKYKNIISFPARDVNVMWIHNTDVGRHSPGGDRVLCREHVPSRHIRLSDRAFHRD